MSDTLALASGINANRIRVMFRFWLDVCKDIESELADRLSALIESKQFKPTVVKALLLFFDLSQGNTDRLQEYFPFVLREAAATLPTAPQRELPAPTQPAEDLAGKLEVTKSKQVDRWGNYKILYNMLLSQYAHDPRHWDHFSADNLEYGLETGKFPSHLIKQAQTLLADKKRQQAPKEGAYALPQPPTIPEIKQIAGAARELPPPDDFEEDWL